MKYITTDKHPELKEGIELDSTGGDFWAFKLAKTNQSISRNAKNDWLKKGYIKELKKPEFTK